MNKGSKELRGKAGSTITIRSSGQFCAYGMEKKVRTLILGPLNTNQRVLRYKLPPDINTVYVKAEKSTEWTIEWSFYDHSEQPDPTPVEMPIGYQHPESLADQMRRFIRQEVSAARDDDQGSFEDEDDFEDDDPILTDYELTDMQEVEEILAEDDHQDPDAGPGNAVGTDNAKVQQNTAKVQQNNADSEGKDTVLAKPAVDKTT